jgi:hypothetical protein
MTLRPPVRGPDGMHRSSSERTLHFDTGSPAPWAAPLQRGFGLTAYRIVRRHATWDGQPQASEKRALGRACRTRGRCR